MTPNRIFGTICILLLLGILYVAITTHHSIIQYHYNGIIEISIEDYQLLPQGKPILHDIKTSAPLNLFSLNSYNERQQIRIIGISKTENDTLVTVAFIKVTLETKYNFLEPITTESKEMPGWAWGIIMILGMAIGITVCIWVFGIYKGIYE